MLCHLSAQHSDVAHCFAEHFDAHDERLIDIDVISLFTGPSPSRPNMPR